MATTQRKKPPPFTEEHRKNMSLSKKGKPSRHKRKKKSEEFKVKVSNSKKWCIPRNKWLKTWIVPKTAFKKWQKLDDCKKWDKHRNWQWWKSFEEYPQNWTNTLKRSIRERDNYTYQIYSKSQGDVAHNVHHIDYNKKNCNPENLITLCKTCHNKTNFNKKYRENILLQRTKSFNI